MLGLFLSAVIAAPAPVLPIVNDPYYSEQWNLESSGPFRNKDGKGSVKGGDNAHVGEAWQIILNRGQAKSVEEIGRGVRLAIIDDGLDIQHEEFKGKIAAYKNFGEAVVPGNLFSQAPRNFHGTLVTGIAAAKANNGVGIAGACPGCQIVVARISSATPAGLTIDQYYEQVFQWVMDQDADIINCSWGPGDESSASFFAYLTERLKKEGRRGKGIIVIAAGGNDGKDVATNWLASQESVITVGASDSLGQRYSYSRTGDALDILAPSSGGAGGTKAYVDRLWTTDNYIKPDCLKKQKKSSSSCSDTAGWSPKTPMAGGDSWDGKYSYRFSHTSAATPLVSGIVGLMLEANPQLTSSDVQAILRETADKVDPANARYNENGFSPSYGYGRINAARAVARAYDWQ